MSTHESSDLQSQADAVYMRWSARRAAGEQLTLEDACADRPDLLEKVRTIHEQQARLARVRDGADVGGAPAVPSRDPGVMPWNRDWKSPSTRDALQRLAIRSSGGARYRRVQRIAQGGMGQIVEVWDEELRRPVAMKLIREDRLRTDIDEEERWLRRLLEEAQITAQLVHPSICSVHEVGVDAHGRVYFTMPLVEGDDLSRVFELARADREGWNLRRAVDVLHRVCQTIAFAHARGVVHRDLKPSNVRVGKFGEVYVLDWGVARPIGSASEPGAQPVSSSRRDEIDAQSDSPMGTESGAAVGTIYYMPPEQAVGSPAAEAFDVYAIGAMLYELLTGRAPYTTPGADKRANFEAACAALEAGRAPASVETLAPDVSPELASICERAMHSDPRQRYANVGKLAQDIQAWIEGRVVSAHATGAWVELRKWIGRNRALATTTAAALVLILATAAVFLVVLANRNEDLTEASRQIVAKSLAQARGRGNWTAVLDVLDQAPAGAVDPVDAAITRAQAYTNLQRYAEARSILEPLVAAGGLGEREGHATYLLGEARMLLEGWTDGVEALYRTARACELPPSEALLIDGLLAPTLPVAVDLLGRALEIDPYLHDARVHRSYMLLWLERDQEALRELDLLAEMHPDNASARGSRLFMHALLGVPGALDQARSWCGEQEDDSTRKFVAELLRAVQIARETPAATFLGSPAAIGSWALLPATSGIDLDAGASPELWRHHPLVSRVSRELLARALATDVDEEAIKRFDEFAPNSISRWFRASTELDLAVVAFGREGGAEEARMRLARTADVFLECAETARLLPALGHAARRQAALANALLGAKGRTGEDPVRLARAKAAAHGMLARPDLAASELEAWSWPVGVMNDPALQAQLDERITVARAEADRAKAARTDAQVQKYVAEMRTALAAQRWLVARGHAERVLKREPDNAEARAALEEIALRRGTSPK